MYSVCMTVSHNDPNVTGIDIIHTYCIVHQSDSDIEMEYQLL